MVEIRGHGGSLLNSPPFNLAPPPAPRGGDFTITEAEGVAPGSKIIMQLKETESTFSSQSVVERVRPPRPIAHAGQRREAE